MGFGVFKRSSEKDPNEYIIKYATFACNRAQKSASKSRNSLNPRPTTKTYCGAKIIVVLGADKKYHVSKVFLAHNHPFSPSKGRFYRLYRVINRHVKRQLEIHQRVELKVGEDSRCRAAYEEFGDVVTFDTTYLTNEYEMPMAPFVRVNYHGKSILLSCGVISNEDVRTFTWLFQTWLSCMSGRAPNAIITDQDQAMKNAIEIVFPEARHMWCL
ncbi:protein FAR1-RELATED SEQUENCE 2-like [Rutidosis leptorrhynchoides]|uniref:protein FAR1-RELATED SEQUENCE 2-like n=1 Tax=Rutidosis leptorrhynchoides TaxID=125765 RepID=UPI003A9A041F